MLREQREVARARREAMIARKKEQETLNGEERLTLYSSLALYLSPERVSSPVAAAKVRYPSATLKTLL